MNTNEKIHQFLNQFNKDAEENIYTPIKKTNEKKSKETSAEHTTSLYVDKNSRRY